MTTETITTITVVDEDAISVSIDEPPPINVSITEPGPQGATGDTGPAGVLATFVFSSPAATWTVRHNLGHRPIVNVLGDQDNVLVAQVEHPDVNTTVVTHSAPATGSVLVL